MNVVLDNLIAAGQMPPCVAVFLQAGWSEAEGAEPMGPKDTFPNT